jgi:hypothetical protein
MERCVDRSRSEAPLGHPVNRPRRFAFPQKQGPQSAKKLPILGGGSGYKMLANMC